MLRTYVAAGNGVVKINAWNTEGEGTSFDCDSNAELYGYFVRQEPIAVLLLVDKNAKWDQELENVYLVSCQVYSAGSGHYNQHYEYELRPCDE